MPCIISHNAVYAYAPGTAWLAQLVSAIGGLHVGTDCTQETTMKGIVVGAGDTRITRDEKDAERAVPMPVQFPSIEHAAAHGCSACKL